MTRDKAIDIIKDKTIWHIEHCASMVDAFVALGILKLDQPKSAEDRAVEALWATGSRVTPRIVLKGLDDAGLKIVEK